MAKDDKVALALLREQAEQLKRGFHLLTEKVEQLKIDHEALRAEHARPAARLPYPREP